MALEQLVVFNIALLVAIASPRPALLMATLTSASRGCAAGVAVGTGLVLMAVTWTMMALLGLGLVFELFPMVYIGVKFLGGLYLLYLACNNVEERIRPINARIPSARHTFRQGFLVNLLNPKSVLFAAAVLVAVFPVGVSIAESSVIVINHFLVEVAFYSTLAFCISTQAVSKRYLRTKAYIDRGAAIIIGVLGIRLVLSRGEAP